MNTDPTDNLMHELISSIEANTEKTVAVRGDVNAAIISVYQSITHIERTLAEDARERPIRQRQLDAQIASITTRLDQQDQALQWQDRALDTIYQSQRWRGWVLIGIALVIALTCAWIVFGPWQ